MVTDHALLQVFFKRQDLNKRQTQWLQELVDTPILIIYQPSKQAPALDALSHSPMLHEYMNESADSQPSAVG